MRRVYFVGMVCEFLGCNQAPGSGDKNESGSIVFSLPKVKDTKKAKLLSGYRLRIERASGDCSAPTFLDVTRSYENNKSIDAQVASGCDYWLKLEAGSLSTDDSKLQEVYLSNLEKDSKGKLIESKDFSGQGTYTVRLGLQVTSVGANVGLGSLQMEPPQVSGGGDTNVNMEAFIEAPGAPNDRGPEVNYDPSDWESPWSNNPLNRIEAVRNRDCPGYQGLERLQCVWILKLDPQIAGLMERSSDAGKYTCKLDFNLKGWSKLYQATIYGDASMGSDQGFRISSVLTSVWSNFGSSDRQSID